MTRPDPVAHHRESVYATTVRVGPTQPEATAPEQIEVVGVVSSAVYVDATGAGIPGVDLRPPVGHLDDDGGCHLSTDQALTLAAALADAVQAAHAWRGR